MRKIVLATVGILSFLPSISYAHEGSGGGFMPGLTHPVLGFDHLLAMLSVGLLSAQMGGQAIWRVPLTFVLVMLGGGVLGINGIPLFSVELGIALSVLALGVAIALDKKLSPVLAMVFVGFFAIFHGHAHGTEMPSLSKPLFYACGFVLGTAGIHVAGVLVGIIAERIEEGTQLLRYAGAAIAGIGFHLIVG
jgi:urease accessory protein